MICRNCRMFKSMDCGNLDVQFMLTMMLIMFTPIIMLTMMLTMMLIMMLIMFMLNDDDNYRMFKSMDCDNLKETSQKMIVDTFAPRKYVASAA